MSIFDPLPPCLAIAPLARRRKLTDEVAALETKVSRHLERMGFKP